jgi:hypothetical protein
MQYGMGNGAPMGYAQGCGPDCGYGGNCGDCGYGQYGGDCAYDAYGGCGQCNGGCGDGNCSYGNCGCDYGSCDMGCNAECGAGSECCSTCRRRPRYVVFGEFLYLQATDIDITHAQQQNGIGGAGTVPFGDIGTVEQEFSPGLRVGGMIACGECSGVVASFTHFESDAFGSVEAPDVPGGGGAVGSLVHHPGAALTASAGPVDATYEVDYQLADVMCRTIWKSGPRYEVAYLIGAQYGHLDQDFAQTGIFGGGLGGQVDTSSTIDFDGGGLKAGIDAERRLGHGVSVYGRLTGAAMSGRFSSRYSMFNASTDQLLAQANWKDDRVVGHVEYEVGMSLSSMNEHWRATLGYMFSHWTNVVTTSEFIDAVQFDNYVAVGDTVGFDGLVSRVECRW